MAKNKNDDDVEASENMSAESLEFLDQVRKGKSRYFVMGIKGSSISALILKKKPVKDADLKEVRGGGFIPVFGVVTGMGTELIFNVAKSDGFETPPANGKTEKLKKFLSEQTGKVLKPEWAVVAVPLHVSDEDEATGENAPVPSPTGGDAAKTVAPGNKILEALKKLGPQIQAASAKHPQRIQELTSAVALIKSRASVEPPTDAKAALEALVALLKQLLQSVDADSDSSPSTPNNQPSTTELTSFELLNEEDALANLFDEEEEEDAEEETTESEDPPLLSLDPMDGPELSDEELARPIPEPVAKRSASIGGRLLWQQAKEEVDENLVKLQAKLLETDDEDLKAIGECGFNRVTGKLQVGLRVALTEFDLAPPDAQDPIRQKALGIIAQYREFLATNVLVQLVDANNLGVEVNTKGILGKALDELESMLNETIEV